VIARPTAAAVALAIAGGLLGLTTVSRAALPPDRKVDQKEVCLVCHDLEAALAAPVKHAPVQTGDCTSCHNPHVSRFEGLLRERPAALCVECHADVKQALSRPVVHEPVAEGRCVDCHEPHGSSHAGLLVRSSVDLCRGCHQEVSRWESRPVKHPPFAQGDCSTCHDPHAADNPGLAAKPGGGICSPCHPVTDLFRQRHRGYPVERAECDQCHDPHASGRKGLFRARLHPPFEEGDCTTCHASAGASDPFALVAGEDELCGTCHEDQVEESRAAAFPHVSAGGSRCTDCHNPHTGDGESLLRDEEQSLCLGCHDPGGAKSGQSGRYLTHGDDLPCTTCHEAHGGAELLLLRGGPVEVCAECHTHEHGIRHPLGEGTRDPRSGNPMSCLSCHGIHDAPYPMYLHRSDERELCLGCHKDIGGGR